MEIASVFELSPRKMQEVRNLVIDYLGANPQTLQHRNGASPASPTGRDDVCGARVRPGVQGVTTHAAGTVISAGGRKPELHHGATEECQQLSRWPCSFLVPLDADPFLGDEAHDLTDLDVVDLVLRLTWSGSIGSVGEHLHAAISTQKLWQTWNRASHVTSKPAG